MRILVLFCLCMTPFYLSSDSVHDEQPSLMQALKMFYEQNGGSIENLHLEKKEEPSTRLEGALKKLLQDIKEAEEKPKEEEAQGLSIHLNPS